MSRVGKKAVELPSGVKVNIGADRLVAVEGPKGKLSFQLPSPITASVDAGKVLINNPTENRSTKALHGLSRALVNNMVLGVSQGFVKKLEINGVGFKAAVKGDILDLSLGFSHPVNFPIPSGIKVTVLENTKVTIEGIDKHLVGQVAADIRAYYPPEPYKGKGIKYSDEVIRRKAGKSVK